ncbi:hypothetical protein GLOIN_2v1775404 [Rhizophagus irregularis DAOM 181602=DAOM 197198]|nr:hypothetical protein GLOIN_2v1775404 [Rhizophagus irregularis DAOM 181602=DAOM 197198]CAG8645816.1 6063_t:CDS:2 [Rhizophagus irregularis]
MNQQTTEVEQFFSIVKKELVQLVKQELENNNILIQQIVQQELENNNKLFKQVLDDMRKEIAMHSTLKSMIKSPDWRPTPTKSFLIPTKSFPTPTESSQKCRFFKDSRNLSRLRTNSHLIDPNANLVQIPNENGDVPQ